LYCHLDRGAPERLAEWLLRTQGLSPDPYGKCVINRVDREVVGHAIRVAAGLDSLVLGEPQILGQMKEAYQTARSAGTVGRLLNRLFQHVFSVAKQIRSSTAIGASPVSVAFAAVRLAQQIFGDLSQHSALLIGAGETIELSARHLHAQGLGRLVIANRSIEGAQRLVEALGGYATTLTDMAQHLADADIVITATASEMPIISAAQVKKALKARKYRPIFMVDIAVPRDIEPSVGELDDIYLYTVDDLQGVIEENLNSRQQAALEAEEIVEARVADFMRWWQSLAAVDTVKALRRTADRWRDEVLNKALKQLASGAEAETVVRELAWNLTNKLTHAPSVKLREALSAERADILESAREIFDLKLGLDDDGSDDSADEQPPE
jgi:glutamyl-tRNA reductase